MQNHITCPKCRHEINVEAVLSEQIEASLQVEWNRKNAEFIKREQAIKDAQQLIDTQVLQKVQLREAQLRSATARKGHRGKEVRHPPVSRCRFAR